MAKEILSKKQIWTKKVYNKKSELLKNVEFRENGNKYQETLYSPDEKRETIRYYHKNGVLSSEMYRKNRIEYGIYRQWNKNGKLIKSWKYDEKGKAKKETVKKYK